MRHARKRRHASSSLEGGSVAAHVVGELEGGHHGVLLRHAPQDEVGLASADALLAACTAGFAPGRHSHTSHPHPMSCVRAARTVGACTRQPPKPSPRRWRMAPATYSTALSSDSSPRLYSSEFFAGPEPWWLISANTSRNVRAR